MYSSKSNLTIAFHGCERKDQQKLISDIKFFKKSQEAYDWLGHVMYFWDGNEKRALEWAKKKKNAGTLKEPAVLGAVLDLGRCFDLLDSANINALKYYYNLLKLDAGINGYEMPRNIDHPKEKGDKVLRYLDCAVIEFMHNTLNKNEVIKFDSVKAAFIEGNPIYPDAGFNERTHIQICIINPNCIKGIFLPRKLNINYQYV